MIAEGFEIGLDQNVLPELYKVDRCITCHAGIDDPRMVDQAKDTPYYAHPGNFLMDHPPSKYGCTICHQGQGRATSLPDAHGHIPFWPEPLLSDSNPAWALVHKSGILPLWPELLLTDSMVYTSCGRCHYENDLYGEMRALAT